MKSLCQYVDHASSTHFGFGAPAGRPGGAGVRQSFFASKNATSLPNTGTSPTFAGVMTSAMIPGSLVTPVKSNTVVPPSYNEETPRYASRVGTTFPLWSVQ